MPKILFGKQRHMARLCLWAERRECYRKWETSGILGLGIGRDFLKGDIRSKGRHEIYHWVTENERQ